MFRWVAIVVLLGASIIISDGALANQVAASHLSWETANTGMSID